MRGSVGGGVVITAGWIRYESPVLIGGATFWKEGTHFDMSESTIRFLGAEFALRALLDIVILFA